MLNLNVYDIIISYTLYTNKLRSLYDNKYIQTPFWEDWLEDK